MEIKQYVAGFLFSRDLKNVMLIRKTKPAWQAGKLNAIGGKIEPGETEYGAMVREFEEETGIKHFGWKPYAQLIGEEDDGREYIVHFFVDTVPTLEGMVPNPSPTEEVVDIYPSGHSEDRIPNLNVLVPHGILFMSGVHRQIVQFQERPQVKESTIEVPSSGLILPN